MRSDSANLFDTFESARAKGAPSRGGHRALVITSEGLSALQRTLLESVGSLATRASLAQMGFSDGREWAICQEQARPSVEQEECSTSRLASVGLQSGWFQVVEAAGTGSEGEDVHLIDSHEAHRHRAEFGQAGQPVCWTLCGFLSGFFSQSTGQDIIAVEQACQACGAPSCQFAMRSRQSWEERPEDSTSTGPRESLRILPVDAARELDAHSKKGRGRPPSAGPGKVEVVGLVTESDEMQATVGLAQQVARVDSTVLISGESGTGKERIARLLHEHSQRKDQPFIAVNCGAIPEGLIESELFGHARGSFSGAIQAHMGMFEAAHHGTILLDEIGEISEGLQLKLLRVLQEREVRRVGEERSRPIDFRVIAATNRNLAERVEHGLFRRDLYYRLHVVEITVPPLRKRQKDILPLARELLANAAARMNRTVDGFSPEVVDRLLEYRWPGNVRELENAMERAVALASGTRVQLDDLPVEVTGKFDETPDKLESVRPLQDISKDYILAALDLNCGNQTHTARQLGIGTATLYRKLKLYGYLNSD